MFNKSFLWFSGSVLCASLAFAYLFWIYLAWDDPVPVEDSSVVEVTLPVINWGKYQELSKRLN